MGRENTDILDERSELAALCEIQDEIQEGVLREREGVEGESLKRLRRTNIISFDFSF